jgi:hypothetical protein
VDDVALVEEVEGLQQQQCDIKIFKFQSHTGIK